MARIRTVKPEFWTDSFMVQLPHLARLLYIALWTAADDHGYIRDEPDRIAMELMPKEPQQTVDDYIQLFIAADRLELFVSEDHGTFLRVAKWESHQKVDKPSKSRIFREGSRKLAIPAEVRKMVAANYGCEPGGEKAVECYYCGRPGSIHWHQLHDGRASGWISFPGLELDHLEAEADGNKALGNIVLACRFCNRSKGKKHWIEALSVVPSGYFTPPIARFREASPTEGKGKERKGKEKNNTLPVAVAPVDERKAPIREAIKKGYAWRNENRECPWGAAEETILKRVLLEVPASYTAEFFIECIRNKFKSDEAHSPPPREWLKFILTYADGPIDRFRKPKNLGDGNGRKAQLNQDQQRDELRALCAVAGATDGGSDLAAAVQKQRLLTHQGSKASGIEAVDYESSGDGAS